MLSLSMISNCLRLTFADICLSVIFVHSIHAKDWTSHQELYSKLFPDEQPHPRVLTYGYDPSLWQTTSGAGYEDAAKELLSELEGTNSKVKLEGISLFYIMDD